MDDYSRLLPDDLLVDILCRLNPEDVIRFKCVSKAWCRLISDTCVPVLSRKVYTCGIHFRYAAMRYMVLDEETSKMVTVWSGCKLSVLNRFYSELKYSVDKHFMTFAPLLRKEPEHEVIKCNYMGNRLGNLYSHLSPFLSQGYAEDFLDSCNGLLLFSKGDGQYLVCNPTTQQCVAVPKSKIYRNSYVIPTGVHAALAFDPTKSRHYSIVQFQMLEDRPLRVTEVSIFSSFTGSWVQHHVPLDPSTPEFDFLRNNVYLDGVLYVLSMSWKILCFDINNVSFRLLELPHNLWQMGLRGCIGVSSGCLYYVRGQQIWSLDNPKTSHDWVLQHTITIPLLAKRFMHVRGGIYLFYKTWLVLCGIDPSSEAVFIGTSSMILRYYWKTDKLEAVYESGNKGVLPTLYYHVFTYQRCMVTL